MRYPYVPGSVEAHDAALAVFRGGTTPAEPVAAPLVSARPPLGQHEVADGAGQALSTGLLARKHGWAVLPSYYQAPGGEHYCALQLARGDVRAAVTWQRAEEGKWSAPRAYAWPVLRRMPIAELRAHLAMPAGTPLPPRAPLAEPAGKDWTKADAVPRNQWLASGEPLLKVKKGRR